MKISFVNAIIAVSAIVVTSPASAATYIFDFASVDHSASGTFTTTALAPSTITGIDGVADGQAITGLSSFASADNLLGATSPFFTFSGLSFLANGVAYNIYGSGGSAYLFTSLEYPSGSAPVLSDDLLTTNSVTLDGAVPEPATWAMMLVGFGAIGFAKRRKQRPTVNFNFA